MNLTVKNFEILSDVTLPIEGITVLVGASNNGKSSIKRAIESLFENTPGDDYIQYGKSSVTVGLNFPWHGVNHNIARHKDARGAVYFVDGEKYEKVGRKNHVDLLSPFGIRELTAGTRTIHPSLVGQFDPIFMAAYTPTEAFGFLSFMLDETRMQAVLKGISTAVRDQNEELGKLQAVIDVTRGEVLSLQSSAQTLDKTLESVRSVLPAVVELQESVAGADRLVSVYDAESLAVDKNAEAVDRYTLDGDDRDSLNEMPELVKSLASGEELFQQFYSAYLQHVKCEECVRTLSGVADSVGDVGELGQLVARLTEMDKLATDAHLIQLTVQSNRELVASLTYDGSSLNDLENLRICIGSLTGAESILSVYGLMSDSVAAFRKSASQFPVCDVAGDLASSAGLVRSADVLLQSLDSVEGACSLRRATYDGLVESSRAVSKELEDLEGSIDFCPMCSSRLDVGTKAVLLKNMKGVS